MSKLAHLPQKPVLHNQSLRGEGVREEEVKGVGKEGGEKGGEKEGG